MPWAAVAGAVVSYGLNSMSSPSTPSGGYSGGSYLPPNVGQAAANETSLIPMLNWNNMYQQYLPQAQGTVNQALSSPYAQQALSGAQQAGQLGVGQGAQALGASNQLYGQMGQIPGLQNALVQSAFDPQQQLYQYLQAQNAAQTNADLASRGLGMSGAGAQIAAQQNQLFNQNWQNNLLQRQMMGAQGVGSLAQTAARLGTVGGSLGAQGVTDIAQGAAMPYQTQLNATNANLGMLNQLGQFGQAGNAPIQQMIADYNAYQGLGSPAAQMQQQQGVAQGQASLIQPISNAIGGAVGNWASGLGSSGYQGVNTGGYTDPYGGVYNNPSAYTGG